MRAFHDDRGQPIHTPPGSRLRGGHLLDLMRAGPGAWLLEHGLAGDAPLVRVRLGPRSVLLVRDADLIQQVVLDRTGDFRRDNAPVEALFGGGLLSLGGARWKARRALVMPRLRPAAVEPVVAIADREAAALVARWRAHRGAPFRPIGDLCWAMLRILGAFAFGFDFRPGVHGGRPLHRALITLTRDAVRRAFSPVPYWKILPQRDVRQARRTLRALAAEIVDGGVESPAHPNLLGALRAAEAAGQLTREDLIAEVTGFLVAGHETSATALSWLLTVLSTRPALAAACRAEAQRDLGAPAAPPAPAALAESTLTRAVIAETLRLYPAVPIAMHVAARETRLTGYAVPAGTPLLICSLLTHRDPRYWPDPRRFDPTRFQSPDAARHRFAYFPFMLGPHVCAGMRMALLELQVLAGRLLQAFRFEQAGPPVVEDIRVSLHPRGLTLRALTLDGTPAG